MTGAELIAAERQRQMDVEGWTPEHDDGHAEGDLVEAALCYATGDPDWWPWRVTLAPVDYDHGVDPEVEYDGWNPSQDPIRNLVKAGALIAAEIDRLQRAEATSE